VVAADRQWICASFEKEYEAFGKSIGEPGRPLGYLFLDKMFQVSVSVPQQITSPEASKHTEHRLQNFEQLLEPNPRGFKWRGPARSVGRRPFKPQTAHLRQEADRLQVSLLQKLPSLTVSPIERILPHCGVILETVIRHIEH
jgi:hypothetical protein